MRDVKEVTYKYLSMSDLADITRDVYGIAYDVQMGEKTNGTYEIHTPGKLHSNEGYHTGLRDGMYGPPNYDEAEWIEISDEEAIRRWKSSNPESWERPFDKINEQGEYSFYQPELPLVLGDLVERGEIPDGTYFISIDW